MGIFSVAFTVIPAAVSFAIGWAIDAYNVEKTLTTSLPSQLTADKNLLLAAIALMFMLVGNVLGSMVVGARRRYGVKHPITYPSEHDVKNLNDRLAFMSVVRGHENYLENNAQFLFAVLINWIVLKNYSTCFVFSAIVAVARLLYAFGYSIAPAVRGPFFLVITMTTLALHGTLVFYIANAFGVLKAIGVQK